MDENDGDLIEANWEGRMFVSSVAFLSIPVIDNTN